MKKILIAITSILVLSCSDSGKPKGDLVSSDPNEGIIIHPYEFEVMNGFPPRSENLVTLENWDFAPYNRWAYQHFRELVPTQNISRGSGPVYYLEREAVNLDTLAFLDSKGEKITVKTFLEKSYSDGFIVLKNGKILSEHYFTGMRPSTHHLLQSGSKSLAISLLAVLMDQKKIMPDAKVQEYVPELSNSGYADASIAQLMDMESGVSYSMDFSDPHSELNRHMRSYLWKPGISTVKGHRDFLTTLKKGTEHGSKFEYKDSETEVLNWVMEKVEQKPFAELFSEQIWSKLGVEYDAYISCDGLGSPVTCGGFNVTLRDLARVGLLYLNNGKMNNTQILPASFSDDILNSYDVNKFASGPWAGYYPEGTAYNNHWWIPGGHEGAIMACGYQGQYLYIHPKYNVVIVKFSTHPEGDESYLDDIGWIIDMEWRAFYAISKALGDVPYHPY